MRASAPSVSPQEHRDRIRPDARLRRSRRTRNRREALEWLESRTLLAVLPAAQVAGALNDVSTSAGSMSSPLVVVDRYNPLHLASVWVRYDPDLAPGNTTVVQGSYSNDGGATWTSLGVAAGAMTDPAVAPPATGPLVTYTQTINPQVAFDNNHNLYVLTQQTNGTGTSGALSLRKFDFSGNAPVQTISNKIVHQYVQDPIFNPTLTVDDNQATFVDPLTGAVQNDPSAGTVWIGWSTNEAAPTGIFARTGQTWNPNSIQVIGSADGGDTFTAPALVGTGGSVNSARGRYTGPTGTFGNVTPKIAVSQGVAGGPNGGQATVIWDNTRIYNATFDRIQSAAITGGATAVRANGAGGTIAQNTGNTDPNGVATNFQIPVTITDPNFTLSKLTASLTIQQTDMQSLAAYLTAPDGRKVLLFSNAMPSSGTVPTGQTRGVTGANLGIVGMSGTPASPYGILGTTFDDDAARNISDRGVGLGSTGTFRPEQTDQPLGGYVNLGAFNGMTAAQLSGTWTLTIVSYRDNGTSNPAPRLINWGLNFGAGANVGSTTNVATTNVRGSQSGSYSRTSAAAGPQGIGPGIQIAQDNTLGSFSQHQGRIYVTYVGWIDYRDGGYVNPADNTDVFLVTSDDGGQTWTNRGIVNDDQGSRDGFSGANKNTGEGQIAGRAQFLPTVAVDQTTGTLVMSWRDGRDDSARARSSVYVTSSIDGGASFSSQTYANPAQTSTDAITGQQVVIGPRGDGFNSVNEPVPIYGFGSQMGLAVAAGQVFTAWAGNLNASYLDSSFGIHGQPLQTYVQRLTISAGPRIIDGTMGVVGLAGDLVNTVRGPDGGPVANAFEVTFDRPIDPRQVIDAGQASFTPADVLVYYHDTVNGGPFVGVPVLGVTPVLSSAVGNLGYTRFRVEFAASGLVGTYSYIVLPTITDQIRTVAAGATKVGNDVDQNADGVAGQNPLTAVYVGLTPGDAFVAPMPAPKAATTFGPDPLSLLRPPFDSKTLPLIVPGAHLAGTSVLGGTGSDNLLLDKTTSSLLMTFDRDMNASSFTADKVLQIMGPSGSILGPQYFASNSKGELIPPPSASGATGSLTSKLTVPGFGGTFLAANITVRLNIDFPADAGLTAVLVGPDGTRLTLFSRIGGLGSNFTNTVFSDSAAQSINEGFAPFTGTFRPSDPSKPNGLAVFNGKSIEGEWKLEITNTRGGAAGVLRDWSLNITPVVSVTPVNPVGGLARTFSVNFPRQSLSGTYTVQVASSILDAQGRPLDSNLNAGVHVLRGEAANVPTTTVSYGSGQVNQGPVAGRISSRISVPDDFLIQGTTASGRSGLRLRLNLGTNNVGPLTATLVYHPDSSDPRSVAVFSGLIQGPTGGGFIDTLFDDLARTPISQGAPPFFAGPYAPQSPFLNSAGFLGLSSGGTWELVIEGGNATLNSWSLIFEKPLPTSGLGEPVADLAGGSFRILQMNPTDPLSRSEWTAVGPAPLMGSAGRIGAMAVDPSDPTGNTFYVAGASGGIWKTTNFLTTDPQGPTYIPLTDFGPSNGMNIGGLAVFARNNDPNQSIVIASTGEGDFGSPGVGFLISKDGGATWGLFDSATNVDSSGNPLPYDSPLRDRTFVGSTSFKVVVDPTATAQGGVIIYAAISGRNGGLWRSQDTGDHWQLMRSGDATDVVLDPSSNTGGDGNLQIVIAGFQGEGVYLSPNRGQIWNQMAGGVGNPLIVDTLNDRSVPVGPIGVGPNGLWGRIVLAKPALTSSPVQNQIYGGWLYAAVVSIDDSLLGVYMTKDYGQNWVRVRIPNEPTVAGFDPAIPTNDILRSDINLVRDRGNQNITLAIDPTNPNIVYLGGYRPPNTGSGMIRIDATRVWDAHNLTFFSSEEFLGVTDYFSVGAITVGSFSNGSYGLTGRTGQNYLNLIRNPDNPFNANSTIFVRNLGQFANNGFGVDWIPFDAPLTPEGFTGSTSPSYQRLVTMIDPTTGLPRLVFGTNRGVWSVLDDHGVQLNGTSVGSTPTPVGNRNGNLQIAQFFYGAAQPSNAAVAASYDHALFYAGGNDGGPSSSALVLINGELFWTVTGEGATSGGVATNQQGDGSRYQAFVPGSMVTNMGTTFFRVNHVGRTFGLFQQSGGGNIPDPQWGGNVGATFAVNPVNGDQIIISSNTGRIFATETRGVTWFEIGSPAVFGSPGAFSQALAYGAPDPAAPAGVGNLGNFIYVGTAAGQVFTSRTAGGGSGLNWFNISLGLDGSPVKQIITNPARGSHSAYAVTTTGVFFINDSIALGQDPTNAAKGWINVTGDLRDLSYAIFGQTYDPNAAGGGTLDQSLSLATIAVDWRYLIPNASDDPAGAGLHPVLYVGGDTGVFRSLDNGATWTIFPDQSIDGSTVQGGHLPRVSVRDLDLSLGNINTVTGMPNLAGPHDPSAPVATPDPNLLLATTHGRGQFAIKMAPLILPGASKINSADTTGTAPDGTVLVKTSRFRVQGLSMISGFGDATRITILDATDPNNKFIIGGFNPADPSTNVAANWTDAFGNFSVGVNPGAIPDNGARIIQVYATDDSGGIGNMVTFSIMLDADDLGLPVPADPSLRIYGPDNTSQAPPAIYTRTPTPTFVGTTSPGATVELLYQDANGNYASFNPPVVAMAGPLGNFRLTFPDLGVSFGAFSVKAKATNASGDAKHLSPAVAFTIKLDGPSAPPTLFLNPYFDSGIVGDNITAVRALDLVGSVGAVNAGSIIRIYAADANGAPLGQPLAQINADALGNFSVQLAHSYGNGEIRFVATAVDPAGNPAPGHSAVLKTTIVSVGLDYSGNPVDYYRARGLTPPGPVPSPAQGALYLRNGATGFGQWFFQPTAPTYVPSWAPSGGAIGSAGDIPIAGDFDGDGKADLVTFNQSTATWVAYQSSAGGAVFQFGVPGISLPVVGNFDGPGATQFGIYFVNANGIGVWRITSPVTGPREYGFGGPGDIPLVGDFEGLGRDQMAVYRPSTGQFLVYIPAAGAQPARIDVVATLAPNQVPVPGKYDNQYFYAQGQPYRTEAAVFDPATGVFTIARAAGSTLPSRVTFLPGDIPVPGDYLGVGWDQPAVYRPRTTQFVTKFDQTDPSGSGPGTQIAIFSGLLGANVVPPGAPLGYRVSVAAPAPRTAAALAASAEPASPGGDARVAGQVQAPAPVAPTPPVAPEPTPQAPPAPVVVAPSLNYISTNPPGTARPWFAGTAAPGTTVDLFLSGSGVVGSRRVGTAAADAAGNYGFQLPAGARNGNYSLVAQARGADGSSTPIAGASFNIGPAPTTRPTRPPARTAPIAGAPLPIPTPRPPLPIRRVVVAGSAAAPLAGRPAALVRASMRGI